MYDSSLHLFVDDYYIRNLFAMKRTYGKLTKHPQPILEDIPGRLACWACVIREPDGKFRMWYQSVYNIGAHDMATAGVWGRGTEFGFFPKRMKGAIPETQTSVVSYAESEDGFHWVKPNLGLFEWQGSKDNNIVLDGSRAALQFNGALTNMDSISLIRDEDDSDPAKRYKFISHWETVHVWDNFVSKLNRPQEFIDKCNAARAKYLTTSPDGIHWNAPLVRIKNPAGGGDYSGVTRDERNRCWWFNDRAPMGTPGIGRYCRLAGLCVSDDLYHWPEHVEQVFILQEYEDYGLRYEHHGMAPFNYGDQDLCFLEMSVGGRPVTGILGSHRNGERWQLINQDNPLLRLGPKGAHDDTVVAATRNAPFRQGDKLLIFYNGRKYDLKTGSREAAINLATLRLDGFVGLTVDGLAVRRHGIPAMLQTQPIYIEESELQINIQGHLGTAKVALLRENLQPFPGCELEDCLPIAEDAVRAPIHWKERPDISAFKGEKAIVLVQLYTGTIYALHF